MDIEKNSTRNPNEQSHELDIHLIKCKTQMGLQSYLVAPQLRSPGSKNNGAQKYTLYSSMMARSECWKTLARHDMICWGRANVEALAEATERRKKVRSDALRHIPSASSGPSPIFYPPTIVGGDVCFM